MQHFDKQLSKKPSSQTKQANLTDFLNIAEDITKIAKKKGADFSKIAINRSRNLAVDFRLGKLESIEKAESISLAIKIFKGKPGKLKQAVVSCNYLGQDIAQQSEKLCDNALAMAQNAQIDEHIRLAEPNEHITAGKVAENIKNIDLFDKYQPNEEELKEFAKNTEEFALQHKDITNSDGASANYSKDDFILATSQDFAQGYSSSNFSASCSVLAEGEDGKKETDYDYCIKNFWQELKTPQIIGETAANRASRRLGAKAISAGKMPVIFENRVAGRLLSSLASAINGAAIARKSSFLMGKMGEQIFNSNINIIDDPLKKRAASSFPFDAEGIGAARLNIIESGVLKHWLLDIRSASKLGLKTNGRAGGSSNLYMQAGEQSVEEIMQNTSKGLIITDVFGMGVNQITGDYSQGANGLYFENGKILHPVNEITIASNLLDMFKNLTPANDLEFRSSTSSPSLLIEEMSVAN